MINNIFYGNPRGAVYVSEAIFRPAAVRNNLFFSNPDGHYIHLTNQVFTSVAALDAALPEASANLEADPHFVDADYRLGVLSPAIDSGEPLDQPPAIDLDGQARIQPGRPSGPLRIDLGAYETSPSNGGDSAAVDWLLYH